MAALLKTGDKILIVHRKLFDRDSTRFFIGKIDACSDGLCQVTGHTWLKDPGTGMLLKKEDLRSKMIAVGSSTLLFYKLPEESNLDQIKFTHEKDGRVWLSDGGKLKMDLTETQV